MSDEFARYAEQHHESRLKLFESVISSGVAAIRLLAAINGGALIAMLAFAGGIAGKQKPILASLDPLILATGWFGTGLVLAALAAGGMYFTQSLYASAGSAMDVSRDAPYFIDTKGSQRRHRCGLLMHVATVIACFASFACFCVGVLSVIALMRAIEL